MCPSTTTLYPNVNFIYNYVCSLFSAKSYSEILICFGQKSVTIETLNLDRIIFCGNKYYNKNF